ncbi:hypothetical protein DUI87_24826 [Hirundo rustica rustica]|uniref:Uncharacterized protein n=1 Tax=Hirundo rustica rustica TaxID=333673 RepID=A0A3M0JE52_HIRRU|nr:hypothetical protein DUI87_24826 [Hirundo rustica rustica]
MRELFNPGRRRLRRDLINAYKDLKGGPRRWYQILFGDDHSHIVPTSWQQRWEAALVNPGPPVSEGSAPERVPGIRQEGEVLMKQTPFFQGVKGGQNRSHALPGRAVKGVSKLHTGNGVEKSHPASEAGIHHKLTLQPSSLKRINIRVEAQWDKSFPGTRVDIG